MRDQTAESSGSWVIYVMSLKKLAVGIVNVASRQDKTVTLKLADSTDVKGGAFEKKVTKWNSTFGL